MTQSRHAKMMARFADNKKALEAVLKQQAKPVYKDSTLHLHVGDSSFESWFQAQPFATQAGIKQISRDSYAAGMGDPLVVADSQQQAEPVSELQKRYLESEKAFQQQAEPVAWQVMVEDEAMKEFPIKDMAYDWCIHQKLSGSSYFYWIRPLYTTPPQRQWVGLTDEDFLEACQIAERGNYLLAFQRIQIKLKERNHV